MVPEKIYPAAAVVLLAGLVGGACEHPQDLSAVPLITTSSPLPQGRVGVAYSLLLTARGGTPPIEWHVTAGSLPGGLQLDSLSGEIRGTPTAAGTANFSVRATDIDDEGLTPRPFAMTVVAGP